MLLKSDLFPTPDEEQLDDGAVLLRGFAVTLVPDIWRQVQAITATAPFRHLVTPGGHTMSVAMTNCGDAGWVSDRRGYRYERHDPQSGTPWPAMPPAFLALADRAAARAGFQDFLPDACLINRYLPGAKMTLHIDHDEQDFGAPIVSVSLGLPAVFLWGGKARADKARRVPLASGDVVVWGGPSRRNFHGVLPLKDGTDDLIGAQRINLTFRKAL
jgi:alkylated DNA repair protein (DNA oxidative demethylase)